MTNVEMLVPASLAGPLGWTLVHSLWQGALVAAALAAGLAILRRGTPAVRHAISCAAMAVLAAAPAATLALLLVLVPDEGSGSLAAGPDRMGGIPAVDGGASGSLPVPLAAEAPGRSTVLIPSAPRIWQQRDRALLSPTP